MVTKKWFWALLAIVSLACVMVALRLFPRAFPIINIDLRMNRPAALAKARLLAAANGWGPADYKQAADFGVDQDVQNYVELEGGGKDAFARMIKDGFYAPYTWTVRHFREGVEVETSVQFAPDGTFRGFNEHFPEKQAGRNLAAPAARSVAETAAVSQWHVGLKEYDLIEESEELKVGGRRDHVFVYERRDAKIGTAAYRLRLGVSGDRLTSINYFVKIPEAFTRRFQEMRSANETIATVSDVIAGLLYLFGGCVIGLFLLYRQRWVVWKTALVAALVIAGLQALAGVNNWPLEWMGYDTAISYGGFVLDRVVTALFGFIVDFLLLCVSFMAAESLTRKAFPEHIQLWKLWSREPGASVQVAGRTAGGYLLVSVFCAYQVLLYYITARFPGWWTPSDTLVEPNIYASYLPWFGTFATAAHAGVWEECLFRAVPIACGAIIGRHFGNRNRGIVIALVAQAVIFGAAHANYPNQPSYARIVELVLPSLGFGLLYIMFGLLPGIILHFTFDTVWMSLPLFISTSQGVWLDRLLVIVAVLLPVWILTVRRARAGKWIALPSAFRNSGWLPPSLSGVAAPRAVEVSESGMGRWTHRALMICGAAGLLLWFATTSFVADVLPGKTVRNRAIAIAEKTLEKENIDLRPPWRPLTLVNDEPDYSDRFVWQNGGRKAYRSLMDSGYLSPPLWVVRYVRFKGDVAERTEEFQGLVSGEGVPLESVHKIPESRPGKTLALADAQALAKQAIGGKYRIDPDSLVPIQAVPSKLPARRNWEFIYASPRENPLKDGQPRVSVTIDGDEVTRVYKWFYVPDDWKRAERNRQNLLGVLQSASGIVTIVLMVSGLILSIIVQNGRRFSRALFVKVFVILLLLQVMAGINSWPSIIGQFTASEPFGNQILSTAGISLLSALFISLNMGLINGFIERLRRQQPGVPGIRMIFSGIGAGVFAAGIMAAVNRALPSPIPLWPQWGDANTFIPVAGLCCGSIAAFIKETTVFLLLFGLGDRMTDGGKRRLALFIPTALFLALSLAGGSPVDSLGAWLVTGSALALVMIAGFLVVFRHQLSLVPLSVAGMTVLSLVRQAMYNAYPASMVGHFLTGAVVLLAAIYWYRLLSQPMREESKS